jgi:hypothetical protein
MYLTIGNILSGTRNAPSMHAWIPIALLPVGPKRVNKIPGYSVESQEREALQTIHDILRRVLQPLSDAACQMGYEMVCGDERVRLCFPRLFCWIADHMENATIHGIACNRCPVCVCPVDELGENSGVGHHMRAHVDYAAAYKASDAASLNAYGIKNIDNALWSIPNLNPPQLIRADILHNILLGVLGHVMDWVQDFLEHHQRITAFDYVWRRLPPYPGFSVPSKAYRAVSQWSGKEMRDFSKVILGTFTAALRRNSNQPRPTASQVQEFNKAIRCVRYITDFYLMTQYLSHTDQTIGYMQEYLRGFHETKDIFLRFRAGKKTKGAAAEAHKNLLREQTLQVSEQNLTTSAKAKARQDNTFERQELVDEILRDGSHFNFPKIHLISHYAEQITKFGALEQFSTDIIESMHKGFKDAYRRSNKVDSTAQVIRTYTRDHTFAMKDLTIEAWERVRNETLNVGIQPDSQRYLKLQGKVDLDIVSNLEGLERVICLCDVRLATRAFFVRELRGTNSDIERLLRCGIRAYHSLEIPVPKLGGDGFILHHVRCTGLDGFRGKGKRNDWVWVKRHLTSDKACAGMPNGRIVGRLNALFKLVTREGVVYRLAHVRPLQYIKSTALEGMLRVGWPTNDNSEVIRIADIEGMAHLIPLEPEESWLVNNRIDIEMCNTIYD